MDKNNKLLTDEFGHVIIYPITIQCLTDTYKTLLKKQEKDDVETILTNFQRQLGDYLNKPVTNSSSYTQNNDISEVQDIDLHAANSLVFMTLFSFFGSVFLGVTGTIVVPAISAQLAIGLLGFSAVSAVSGGIAFIGSKYFPTENIKNNYICDIKQNNCDKSKDNNLKLKLIRKEFIQILTETFYESITPENLKQKSIINSTIDLDRDFSFNELFCDFSCTLHAIYLFKYMNFEKISNYEIMYFLKNKLTFNQLYITYNGIKFIKVTKEFKR